MKKLYDVYFTLIEPASMVIEAESKEEAEDILMDMSNKEIMERLMDALDMGLKVTHIEEVE